MSTEQTESTTQQQPAGTQQPADAEWGAAPPPATQRSKWTVRRTVIAAVVAVGIAAAGGAAIYAASGSVTNDQTGSGGPGGGRMVMGGPFGGTDGAQHGEFQTGEVTELTDDSITVKSKDDYTKTYVINDDTQTSDGVAKGDDVTVIATTEGATTTATTIMEAGTMPQNGRNGGPPNGNIGTPPNGNN